MTCFKAVSGVHRRCRGAYAVVVMITGFGILGFRDPHGIRPVVFGERKTTEGSSDYMIASESVALDVLGFQLIRDIAPGEAIFVEKSGKLHTRQCAENVEHSPCIFEYVYFARPDSIIDDISVYKARLRDGRKVGRKKSCGSGLTMTLMSSSRYRTPAAPPPCKWPTCWV